MPLTAWCTSSRSHFRLTGSRLRCAWNSLTKASLAKTNARRRRFCEAVCPVIHLYGGDADIFHRTHNDVGRVYSLTRTPPPLVLALRPVVRFTDDVRTLSAGRFVPSTLAVGPRGARCGGTGNNILVGARDVAVPIEPIHGREHRMSLDEELLEAQGKISHSRSHFQLTRSPLVETVARRRRFR